MEREGERGESGSKLEKESGRDRERDKERVGEM